MGQWEEVLPGKSVPVGGMAYYITPPPSLSNVFLDPYHSVFYLAFVVMGCAIFSKAWMEVSGASSQVQIALRVLCGRCGGVVECSRLSCSGGGSGCCRALSRVMSQ